MGTLSRRCFSTSSVGTRTPRSSAGCGVSYQDHLQSGDKLVRSVFRFHVYYQTRRILEEMKVALPDHESLSWYSHPYDARAYKRLWSEFGVQASTDWRQRLDHGCQGLGSLSTFWKPLKSYRHAHASQGIFFNEKDAIRHNVDISSAWTTFVLDWGQGFTQAGVERLNESIRTYVWALLGSQGQTHSNILQADLGFDSQKQFLSNTEDAISSPVDLPGSIDHYQKTLQYAGSPLGSRRGRAVPHAQRHAAPPRERGRVQQQAANRSARRHHQAQSRD